MPTAAHTTATAGPTRWKSAQPVSYATSERQRREHRGLVQHDVGGVEKRDACDEREEGMPEREGVAGMEPAVRELVDRAERERVERLQLAHAGEVEEAVAADLACDVPERDPEHALPPGTPSRAQASRSARGALVREEERADADAEEQHERRG